MKQITSKINKLKNSQVKNLIDKRINEFKQTGKNKKEVFRELCFCILTAGTSASLGLKTIEHLRDTIFLGSEKDIQKKLKQVYRFHTLRANYLFLARENFKKIDFSKPDIREQIIKNIKGIGMKEASHFLRNIGELDYAIVDFHIIDNLVKSGLIEKPKSLTPKKYLEIENILRKLAEKTNLSLAELDLYLWYMETGKVLK